MIYVLMNPLSNNKKGRFAELELKKIFVDKEITFNDITKINSTVDFCKSLKKNDSIIIAGGDGTLTRFVDDVYTSNLKQKVFLYPNGSGNDFLHDIKDKCNIQNKLIPLNEFIKTLPIVTVNGVSRYFINGIGFGIDGFCCEEGDKIRQTSDKKVNYTLIALKGLFYKYKPVNATITVDGEVRNYKNVWLAPTMIGRFYGGGMMIAPNQDRLNKEHTVTNVVCHKVSKFKVLITFPKIFTGKHIKHTDMIDVRVGHDVKVEFDKPTALQIDGETVKDVTSYSVLY